MTDRPLGAYAAVDLGASSGRVMVGFVEVGVDGDRRVRMSEVHRFANGPQPDSLLPGATLRWDADRLFDETLHGLAAAVRAAGAEGRELTGIGVDSWGVDYAVLPRDATAAPDSTDVPRATSVPTVDHHRGADPAGPAEAEAAVGAARAYAVSGIPPQPINTSYRLRADRARRADPSTGGDGGTVLLVPDLWVHLMSGATGAERTIASTTQLLDAQTGDWSAELVESWQLEAFHLPETVAPGAPAGVTLPWVTERIGAAHPVPVFRVAGHDTASALAFAIPDDGQLLVSSGSWSLAGLSLSAPVLTDEAFAAGLTNERGVGDSTLLLRNLSGLWLLGECTRQWSIEAGRMLDPVDLVRQAAEFPAPAVAAPVFDVGDERLLAPGDMPERIARLCVEAGRPAPEGILGTVRSIVESLAVAYAESVELLAAVTGISARSVRIVGGGSRNALLCRRTAELTGLPVVAGPAEASAFGNLAVQLVAAGEFGSLAEVYAVGGEAGGEITRYEPAAALQKGSPA